MIIVSAADERYVRHFAAMLHSAWTHHPDARFYLLDCGISPQTLAVLTDWTMARGIPLTVIKIDLARFAELPTSRIFPAAVYARLLIPELLPPDAERAIYIDADCVVVGSLSPLWDTALGDAAIAGVRDRGGPLEGLVGEEARDYINSGVLLMNLSVWRRNQLAAAALNLIMWHDYDFPDQTAINLICSGRKLFVSNGWNLMLGDPPLRLQGGALRILHWTAFKKPWLYRDALFGAAYLYHRKQTPFATASPTRVHRSWGRRFVNLLVGRPKYWRPVILGLRCQSLVDDYLARVAPRWRDSGISQRDLTFLRDQEILP
jgi:lipopolysaccharide biosynthesis glycosyltransferase